MKLHDYVTLPPSESAHQRIYRDRSPERDYDGKIISRPVPDRLWRCMICREVSRDETTADRHMETHESPALDAALATLTDTDLVEFRPSVVVGDWEPHPGLTRAFGAPVEVRTRLMMGLVPTVEARAGEAFSARRLD